MEVLIIILLAVILLTQAFICWVIVCIEKWLSVLCNIEPEPEPEAGSVTDPFSRPKEIYSSTSEIVIPKSPQEIKNENFKKIKDGMEYGDIARG